MDASLSAGQTLIPLDQTPHMMMPKRLPLGSVRYDISQKSLLVFGSREFPVGVAWFRQICVAQLVFWGYSYDRLVSSR